MKARKTLIFFGLVSLCFVGITQTVFSQVQKRHIEINPAAIHDGIYVMRVALNNYAAPDIRISNAVYKNISPSEDITIAPSNTVEVLLGKELKKPFAVLHIPVYKKQGNQLLVLSSAELSIEEDPAIPSAKNYAKTTASNSVLANGDWYKIAIPERGVYKIDYGFIQSQLGVNPDNINPDHIRIYGNGGTMLSENNAVARPDGLIENAITVIGGNDGQFDQGDYILFYANGPTAWSFDSTSKSFVHQKNIYADSSYYFLNFDQGIGKRITSQGNAPVPNVTVTSYNDYQVHDTDITNIGKFGREWWGEAFHTTKTQESFHFDLGNITDSVLLRMQIASRGDVANNSFDLSLNGQNIGTYFFNAVNLFGKEGRFYDVRYPVFKLPGITGNTSLSLTYNSSGNSTGYLNFIEWNTRRQLAMANGWFSFRDINSIGSNKVAKYNINNATANVAVWDVTNPLLPVKMKGSLSGNVFSFTQNAHTLHEFVAFDGTAFKTPVFAGSVINQNIRGQDHQDYLIVTHPDLLEAARKLAAFHREQNNYKVLVVTTGQVYNEFSSGSQDISAIRDFAKYFYDNAGTDTASMPKYLLLLGDASYDYKDRIDNNTNYVPTYETIESNDGIYGYCTDDFFAFLDDNENAIDFSIANTMDIGVGRLPVSNKEEAMKVVDKIINYKSPKSLGPWRLSTTLIADYKQDIGEIYHLGHAEDMAATINNHTNFYNENKVYLASIPSISTPGGRRAPEANKSINDQVAKGTFLINYSGHGSTLRLSDLNILSQEDFNKWHNADRLPIMVTATCDFSRFDNPEHISAGEHIMVKDDGGAIALLTTTQLVYPGDNRLMNIDFLESLFKLYDGEWPTFGDAFRMGKNQTYIIKGRDVTNFRKFALLGDPALTPAFPLHKVVTDSLLDGHSMKSIDSMKALGYYFLKGSVRGKNNVVLHNFNGNVFVTIYDKPKTQTTIYGSGKNGGGNLESYQVQNNIIFKGKATVQNGKFSIAFITPKDLNYDFGKGKISYYVENGLIDGAGADTNIIIGGFSDNPIVDNDGPEVKPFIDDSLFKDGGITGSNTTLYVQLYDKETGINVSGNSIGHDLTAILDNDVANPYILNDYYETATNDFTRGYVHFPVNGLTNGKHSLRVKAWDMNNNSGEGVINFVVIDGNVVQIDNLYNYPNPFSDLTHFVFQHNHPNEDLKATIHIYNMTGALVASLQKDFTAGSSRSNEITWDGTSNMGAKLPSGMYIYKLNLSTEKGIQTTAYQKLLLMR